MPCNPVWLDICFRCITLVLGVKENMINIGVNLHARKGLSDEEYIKEIANCGFNATFSGVYDEKRQYEIADLCAKNGIIYETIHAPFEYFSINGMWLKGNTGNRMLERLKKSVDNCVVADVGIMVLHLSSGDIAPPATKTGKERFSELVEYAASKNVKIAFENQRKLKNISWAFETFPKGSNVGFCWDIGHESCFTPGREYMPLFGDRILCTHIHDNSGKYNADDHLIPFDGKIDYKRKMELLREYGYKGSLMLELKARNNYDDLTIEEYLQKAAISARKLVEMLDN